MPNSSGQKRTRLQRVAALELPPRAFDRLMDSLGRASVLWRIALCVSAAIAMWVILGGWSPPFPYRLEQTPPRDIDSKVAFKKFNQEETRKAKDKAESQVRYVYVQDATGLRQLRDALKNAVADIGSIQSLAKAPKETWTEFCPPPAANAPAPTKADQERDYKAFHEAFDTKEERTAFGMAIDRSFADLEQKGILVKLDQESDQGNQTEIEVHPAGIASSTVVPVAEVRFNDAIAQLNNRLKAEVAVPDVATRVFFWLKPKLANLNPTLKKDDAATARNIKSARDAVDDVHTEYVVGDRDHRASRLAEAGKPLDQAAVGLLKLEYQAEQSQRRFVDYVSRSLAVLGMFAALFSLTGLYIHARCHRLLPDFRRFCMLLGLTVLTVALCKMAGEGLSVSRAELVPLLLFAMTVAIAYNQELALLLSAEMSLVTVVGSGQGLPEYVTLLSAAAAAIFLLRQVRSRSKLIYVGLASGAVASLTSIGVHVLDGQPLDSILLREAGWVGLWAVAAGFLMTGLLPFIEKAFGVLTDLSLLEIGDPAHPLLQELVRRAPGTYNHSINVASIAEAAAESIGAHALLVRIGAYFHDIGKMLKPGYFVENQGIDPSRHEDLLPAMSTLIIIAHIKDGADLARQHHLPQPIVDFIIQHHGTTLVEYFYRRASEQSESDPDAAQVDENSYRYPGPKPLTKEAAVLMMADAAESASRTLVEPAPARIEGLVHDIALNRLLDGQFDECGLTLHELQEIEESLVKSLTAVYHGRVKYPDQRTA